MAKIHELEIWRREQELTQAELAEKVGLNQQRISLLESGSFPKTSELESLMAAGCPVDKIWK